MNRAQGNTPYITSVLKNNLLKNECVLLFVVGKGGMQEYQPCGEKKVNIKYSQKNSLSLVQGCDTEATEPLWAQI